MEINILAIDQASTLGWATKNAYGTWDLTTRKDESIGMKLLRFEAKLREVCQLEKINLITYERVSGQHKNSIIHASKLVAIIERYAEENNINYKAYSAKEIKSFATGNGNASKEKMVQAAKEKHGYTGESDNEADAIFIYHLTVHDLNL